MYEFSSVQQKLDFYTIKYYIQLKLVMFNVFLSPAKMCFMNKKQNEESPTSLEQHE